MSDDPKEYSLVLEEEVTKILVAWKRGALCSLEFLLHLEDAVAEARKKRDLVLASAIKKT